jgi:predicted ATPase/class 3 adenylate cyclase
MESPSIYIPMDRRQALARGETLPDRSNGAALFADISGFTPLTETLLKEYGPRRGAEELTRQLNLIYDALVTEVHRYRGSVLAFSGDAITCWLDGDDGLRATACGLAMQQIMERFSAITTPSGARITLAMKVAIATGPVRRFQVGNPDIQFIDALAGATLDRMAEAEHHAEKGEVVVTAEVVERLGPALEIAGWRYNPAGDRFAVVGQILPQPDRPLEPAGWPMLPPQALSEDTNRRWVLPPIYDRLRAGKGQFLAELRPAVVLFLYFSGIDYDHDEAAGRKLDSYLRRVQEILAGYETYPLQLTIGDKGSYLYAAFGAPIAHEDEPIRAVRAALALQTLSASLDFIDQIQIGISQGPLYSGAYGGHQRGTYGALGDVVNLSARLMQAAGPGQILVSHSAQQSTADLFRWERLPAFQVKGKAEAVVAYRVEGVKAQRTFQLTEPLYALPMVGRQDELKLVADKIGRVLEDHGQIVAIIAEAGMGKSRLVAEVISLASRQRLVGYGGECQSYGTNTSYLVWQPIWRALFNLDSTAEAEDQIRELEGQLEYMDPRLLPRIPLLGPVLNLSIPDNALTQTFDAELRKTSLESFLVDCLRLHARLAPLLLVLEDCHWLDPLSHDLLEVIGRAIVDLPVLLVMAYRPVQLERLKEARLEKLPYFQEILLADFTPAEAEQLIDLKMEQFFGPQTEIPPALLQRIMERAQGNPFYIEELLNYLQDQHFDPRNTAALEQLDLPVSLHSLILSRIDQLTEPQKNTLKVASVIGRSFQAAWLWGMYPELGEPDQIKTDLETLHRLELVPMDKSEPELAYLFKHIVTQEVAYESLPYATRSMLHDYLGQYLERSYPERLDRFVNLLAFHYDRSNNETKKREYLRKAGELARRAYALEAASDYYRRVVPLLAKGEQIPVLRQLGEVERLLGHWDKAETSFNLALELAQQLGDRSAQGWCQIDMAELLWLQSLYHEAATWLEAARVIFEELEDQAGVGQVWHKSGLLAAVQGDLQEARLLWEKSLAIRRVLGDEVNIANMLNNLALVARNLGEYEAARSLNEQALELREKIGDNRQVAVSLNNLGQMLTDLGEYETARGHLEVAVKLQREMGNRWELANALHTLANAVRDHGDYLTTRPLYEESLTIFWELGERWMLAYVLDDLGGLAARQGQPERALRLAGAAAALREATGASLSPAEQDLREKILGPARQALGPEMAAAAESQGRNLPLEEAVEYARRPAGGDVGANGPFAPMRLP